MTPLSHDEIADLLRARLRAEAEAAAAQEPDPRSAMRRTTLAFLRLIDGADPLLPAFQLMPVPHPDNEELAKAEGRSWYPEGFIAGGLEDAFIIEAAYDDWPEPQDVAGRAWTPEEMRDWLLRTLRVNEEAWLGYSRPLDQQCLGLAFSAFATVDGSGLVLPGCDWLFEADEAPNRRRAQAGLRPFPERGVVSTELHNGFHGAVAPEGSLPAIPQGPIEDETPGP